MSKLTLKDIARYSIKYRDKKFEKAVGVVVDKIKLSKPTPQPKKYNKPISKKINLKQFKREPFGGVF